MTGGVIRGDYVKVPKEMFEPLAEIVRIGLFRDEKDALRGIIREQAKKKQNLLLREENKRNEEEVEGGFFRDSKR